MSLLALGTALLITGTANAAPIAAKKLLGPLGARPVDGGASWYDGRPVFGPSKTVRGLLVSLLAGAALAPLVGLAPPLGLATAAAAMAGDLASSFMKRRLGRSSSSRALGLDQVPESLFPLLVLRRPLALSTWAVGLGVAIFFFGELILSQLLYRVHLRDQPY
jgi:CDP-2,3-bis-(O-geranylgeranyl)-sn-glycerol synthase